MEDFDCLQVDPSVCFIAWEFAESDHVTVFVGVADDLVWVEEDLVIDERRLVREVYDSDDRLREFGEFHGAVEKKRQPSDKLPEGGK